jgi:hypothetical protein
MVYEPMVATVPLEPFCRSRQQQLVCAAFEVDDRRIAGFRTQVHRQRENSLGTPIRQARRSDLSGLSELYYPSRSGSSRRAQHEGIHDETPNACGCELQLSDDESNERGRYVMPEDRRSRRKAVSPSMVLSNTGKVTAPEFGIEPAVEAKSAMKAPAYHRVGTGKRRPRKR